MLSIRAFSRALPKSAFRPLSSSLRTLSTRTRPSFLYSSWNPSRIPTYSSFSTTALRREPALDSDVELAAKFDQERDIEQQNQDADGLPESFQDYSERSGFEILDKPGTLDVTLVKRLGNEMIKVYFTVNELTELNDEMSADDEDTALEDEPEDYTETESTQKPKRTINQAAMKGGPVDVAPEDSIAPADREAQGEEMDATPESDYPITLKVTITKEGAGAVEVAARAHNGIIEVEEVYYLPKASLTDPMSPEETKEFNSTYSGPPFSNLDPELQSMLERYVDERGINSELANFLPGYVEYKEQREYVDWLANMQNFVAA